MILVLGGTHECLEIINMLKHNALLYTLTVTTELGKSLYGASDENCIIYSFDEISILKFIKDHGVKMIIDATHPHASVIKTIAANAAKKSMIPYIVYGRNLDTCSLETTFEEMSIAIDYLKEHSNLNTRIMITGVKHISDFKKHFSPHQLVFRIMPSKESIEYCLNEEIPIENIVAIKSPCSEELNRALFSFFKIDYFVFKNSGAASAYESNINSVKGANVKPICIQPKYVTEDSFYTSILSPEQIIKEYFAQEVLL